MSDLISRSELINYLDKERKQIPIDSEKYNIDSNVVDGMVSALQAFENKVKEVESAYDVDKVVEELESFSKLAEDRWTNGTSKYAYQEHKCWVKAIEIVKHGGVSDDVCEWEKGSSGYVGYPAYYSKCCATKSKGLEMQTHIIADWKYCPYCGKKIKIVGD